MFDLIKKKKKAHFICDKREPSEDHCMVVVPWGVPITCQQGLVMLLPFGEEFGLPKRGLEWFLVETGRPVLI